MNPTPTELVAWLTSFAFLLGILVNVAILISMKRTQKREVSFADNFATAPELQRVADEVRRVEEKMDRSLHEIRTSMRLDADRVLAAGEHRAEKIHERMNLILANVHEVKGELKNKVGI